MKNVFSLKNSMEIIASLIAAGAFLQVVYQFAIEGHYLIPTVILFVCVVFGNLARHGFRGALWAKHMLFWFGFIITWCVFFGIFFAVTPRTLLGGAFEVVFIALFLFLAFLTLQYRTKNNLEL